MDREELSPPARSAGPREIRFPVSWPIAAVVSIVVLSAAPTYGAIVQWTGGSSGVWHTASNWDIRVPIGGDDAYLTRAATGFSIVNYNGYYSHLSPLASLRVDQTGGGAMWLMMNVGGFNLIMDDAYIGRNGIGAVSHSTGVFRALNNLYLGYSTGSVGAYVLSGTGRLDVDAETYIGRLGTGSSTISEGRTATSSGEAYLGFYAGSSGTMTVENSGSTWNTNGLLLVGRSGTGELNVEDGGFVDSDTVCSIGRYSGSVGTVTVTGVDSKWDVGLTQYVGFFGTGTMTVEKQGKATIDGTCHVGYQPGGSGTVNVRDSGSTVDLAAFMYVGGTSVATAGTGHLNVTHSGLLTAPAMLTIGNTGTMYMDYGGQVTAGSFVMESGATFNHDGGTLTVDGGTFDPGASSYTVSGLNDPTLKLINGTDPAMTNITAGAKGTLELPGGTANIQTISLTGGQLKAAGTIASTLTGSASSTIAATGDLTMGSAGTSDGYVHQGTLTVAAHTVTLHSTQQLALGVHTTLKGGTLQRDAGNFLLQSGNDVAGRGTVEGHFKNQGQVIGDGTGLDERIIFGADWTVTGTGTFERVWVKGTFSPGDSPAAVSVADMLYSGTVAIELGGTTPGSGDDKHDHIKDSGTPILYNGPELSILPWNKFVPEIGDEFVILTWQTSLDGTFGDMAVDSWFTDHGIDFDLHYNNVGGTGDLTIEATHEPATIGDTDGDHDVDELDYNNLVAQFGGPPGVESADFNNDDRVDLEDFAVLRRNFGFGVKLAPDAESGTATPEPGTLTLLTLGGVTVLRRRRK